MGKKKQTKSEARLVPMEKVLGSLDIDLGNNSKIGMLINNVGKPEAFVFNTYGFLDFLSGIDDKLVDRLSTENYHSQKVNVAGWLIDEIEARLPVSKAHVNSLKEALKEARNKGWIDFENIKSEVAVN